MDSVDSEKISGARGKGQGASGFVEFAGARIIESVLGRSTEIDSIRGFLDRTSVDGAACMISGEPGVGKSTLLSIVVEIARGLGFKVLRANGVEFEAEVSYLGLNQILFPISAEIDGIDQSYREALAVALGFGSGAPPTSMLVGNATLSLLTKASTDRPLLLIVDDLQWLDRASAVVLGFVARRLGGSRIGFIAASRSGLETFFDRREMFEYMLPPLDELSATTLLDSHFPGLSPKVRARLLAEAQGNPLALLELPIALSSDQLNSTGNLQLATAEERRHAHGMLAELLHGDPERRAWHLAEAANVPDEEVAALLESAAYSSLRRGDVIAAVKALTRAADLSPSGASRAHRLGEAAYIGVEMTGDLKSATMLLEDARRADPSFRVSLHAAVAAFFLLINGDGDVQTAHRLVVGAIETGDHGYNAHDDGLVEALHNLLLICWLGGRTELWEPFYAALNRLTPTAPDVLSMVSKTFPDPVRTAVGAVDEVSGFVKTITDENDLTRIMRIGIGSVYVDRLADVREGNWRLVQQGREGGAARLHVAGLMHLCLDKYLTGQWTEAQQLADEGSAVCEAHNYQFFAWYFLYNHALLAAARGEYASSFAMADRITQWAVPRSVHTAELFAHHPRVLSAMGQGDFEDAYRHAIALSPAGTLAPFVPHALWVAFDLVESAVHTDRRPRASAHVKAMKEANVAALSTRMALLQTGAEAIIAQGNDVVQLFDRAISIPGADRWPFEYARVQLAYGERLRRIGSTSEARDQLTSASETFQRLGAHPWSERAEQEIRATGKSRFRGVVGMQIALTAQEREIAMLAATGLSNRQIGEKLFLSHRTISTHLYRIFPKLGISSRAALRDALQSLPPSEQ
jgi:DNA-binding CsgD family transcriptional regulator